MKVLLFFWKINEILYVYSVFRSTRESYGDIAIGRVEVGRNSTHCVVRAEVTPEHNVNKSLYKVTVSLKETEEIIEEAMCHGCQGAASGCKHVISFLFWLHRRSEEPSRTEVACYWKKPVLSKISSLQPLKVADMGGPSSSSQSQTTVDTEGCFNEMFAKMKSLEIQNQVTPYLFAPPLESASQLILHRSIFAYKEAQGFEDAEMFQSFLNSLMSPEVCKEIEERTKCQSESKLWHELRFGRITASKIYEAVNCKKIDGSLVESLLGARKLKDTVFMERGRILEKSVLQVVEKQLKIKIEQCGLILNSDWPILGASPDGLNETHAFEVKCPMSIKTVTNYVKNGNVTPKYLYQIQIQMYFSGRENGFFCVAAPDFEKTKNVEIIPIVLDRSFCEDILSKARTFWEKAIFPVLFKMV
uniref:YqaJ viral recombinase domain-containing protein n=1 Tax=Cacopsylla melanoneura TaxID=428564 RepID=A0A8D9F294_9HEMI